MYAVFLELRRRSGFAGRAGWMHGAVQEFYRDRGKIGGRVAYQLQILRKMRNRADYDEGADVSVQEAVDALTICRAIFEALPRV